jgi:hypothetical protein
VATFVEQGFPKVRGVETYGIFAPPGTPESTLQALHTSLVAASKDPALRAAFEQVGLEPLTLTPAEYAKQLQGEREFWAPSFAPPSSAPRRSHGRWRHQAAGRTSSGKTWKQRMTPGGNRTLCGPVPVASVHARLQADPVSAETMLKHPHCAATAPSSSNTQPWRVHVLAGAPMRELGDALVASFGEPPATLPFSGSAAGSGLGERRGGLRGPSRVVRHRPAGRRGSVKPDGEELSFFGAPVGLIFSTMRRGNSWLIWGCSCRT